MPKIIALLILIFASPLALGCGCGKPKTPNDVTYYVHIFKGEVLSVVTTNEQDTIYQTVTFKVLDLLKGPASEIITVNFGGASSCDLEEPNFMLGQIYMISDHTAYTDPELLKSDGKYYGNFCNLRTLLDSTP